MQAVKSVNSGQILEQKRLFLGTTFDGAPVSVIYVKSSEPNSKDESLPPKFDVDERNYFPMVKISRK